MSSEDLRVRFRCREVRGDLARIREVSDSILRAAPDGGFDADDRAEILLALQECLTNVIRHAYRDGDAARVEVRLLVSRTKFRARIRDWGVPFDPDAAQSAGAGWPGDGGYGLLLVDNTMDRVRRWRSGRANWTELLRARRGAPGSIGQGH